MGIEKETFLLNTRISLEQERGEIQKYLELIEQDKKAIVLRASVKKAAEAQLENGVITPHEFIIRVNAENLARQTLIMHPIKLLQAQYDRRQLSGKNNGQSSNRSLNNTKK